MYNVLKRDDRDKAWTDASRGWDHQTQSTRMNINSMLVNVAPLPLNPNLPSPTATFKSIPTPTITTVLSIMARTKNNENSPTSQALVPPPKKHGRSSNKEMAGKKALATPAFDKVIQHFATTASNDEPVSAEGGDDEMAKMKGMLASKMSVMYLPCC